MDANVYPLKMRRPKIISATMCRFATMMFPRRQRRRHRICSPDHPLPRPEPHLREIAEACQKVYKDAHIQGGAMDVDVRFDVLENPRELLVTFRGSESIRDWLINMFAFMVRYDKCKVHAGFLASWCSIDLQVVDAIDKHMNSPDAGLKGVIVAGHSLGSAMATLCALDLHRVRPQYSVRMTTFAGPKVGDRTFADRLSCVEPLTICHEGDIVPKLPVFSLIARSLYHPCIGNITYTAPAKCRSFISRHRIEGFLETVKTIPCTDDS